MPALLLFCLSCCFAEFTGPTSQQPPFFRVSGEEVVMHVRFTDRNGKAIADILPAEVQVFEDGVEQKLQRLLRSTEPFDIALVLDTSTSTHDTMGRIRELTAQFVSQIPETNRFLLVSFDDEVYVDLDWTPDQERAEEAVWQIGTNEKASGTVLYEAVTLAAEKKFKRETLRKAIVLYTDGIDESSDISQKESIKVIEESGILVYAVQFDSREHYRTLHNPNRRRSVTDPPEWEPPVGSTGRKIGGIFVGRNASERDQAEFIVQSMYDNAKKYLKKLAEVSGGGYYETLKVNDLSLAYEKIIDELSKAFTVTYVPLQVKHDGQFHRVKLTTTRPGVVVQQARGGYWAK